MPLFFTILLYNLPLQLCQAESDSLQSLILLIIYFDIIFCNTECRWLRALEIKAKVGEFRVKDKGHDRVEQLIQPTHEKCFLYKHTQQANQGQGELYIEKEQGQIQTKTKHIITNQATNQYKIIRAKKFLILFASMMNLKDTFLEFLQKKRSKG